MRSSDTAGTLDSKVRFIVERLSATDTLEPRRTLTESIQVDDVDKALDALRDSIKKLLPAGDGLLGTNVREMDSNVARDTKGNAVASLVLDVPKNDSPRLQQAIGAMGGVEKSSQVSKNSAVPDKDFARERYVLTILSKNKNPEPILPPEKSVGTTFRAALTSASGALIYSLYLVVTGLLFILPFALIIWPFWLMFKRRKPKEAAPVA